MDFHVNLFYQSQIESKDLNIWAVFLSQKSAIHFYRKIVQFEIHISQTYITYLANKQNPAGALGLKNCNSFLSRLVA